MRNFEDTSLNQPVTPFFSQAELHAGHTALLKRQPISGDLADSTDAALVGDVERFIQRGRATGMLIDSDKDRWASQSILDYWGTLLYRMGLSVDTKLVDFDEAQAPALADDQCPYVGLEAFHENNSEVFFGRQRLVKELLDKTRNPTSSRFIVLLGPSGSGKSSVIRAGLLHFLQKEMIPDGEGYLCLPPMVPGSAPLENLARLLVRSGMGGQLSVKEQAQMLSASSRALLDAVGVATRPTVLFVDQFEEVFTLCDDKIARQSFADNLLTFAQEPGARHIVLLAMRSDYESRVVSLKGFYEAFKQGEERATPMGASELREAIEQPAERVGLKFEDGVVDTLVQDILGEPAALPLLQFTLSKLWDKRVRNRVTGDEYRRLGGGRLALAQSADAFYDDLKLIENQQTAKRILLRMVRPGEELEVTSNRVRHRVLLEMGDDPDRVRDILERLVRARLVRLTLGDTPDDAQVEIAHEALIRNWPRLVGWVEEARTQLLIRRRLEVRASEWRQLGNGKAGLLDAVQLREAEEWLKGSDAKFYGYDESIQDFVNASRLAVDERDKHRKWLVYALLAVGLLVAALMGNLVNRWWTESQTRKITFDGYVASALHALPAHPEQSVESAWNAYKIIDKKSPEEWGQLVSALHGVIPILEDLKTHRDIRGAQTAVFSPDGRFIAVATGQSEVHVWEWSKKGDAVVLAAGEGQVNSATFSSNSQYLATSSDDGFVRVWDLRASDSSKWKVANSRDLKSPTKAVFFLPSAEDHVVTLTDDGMPRIWRWTGAEYLQEIGPPVDTLNDEEAELSQLTEPIEEKRTRPRLSTRVIAVGPGAAIAMGGQDGYLTICQWNPDRNACEGQPGFQIHDDALTSIEFSEDGKYAATSSRDKTARVVEVATGRFIKFDPSGQNLGDTGVLFTAKFNPANPHRIITASYRGKVHVWEWSDSDFEKKDSKGRIVVEANTSISASNKAIFSPDGQEFATVSADNALHLWRPVAKRTRFTPQATQIAAFNGHVLPIESVGFSNDGNWILTASRDYTVRVWNARPSVQLNHQVDSKSNLLKGVIKGQCGENADSIKLNARVKDTQNRNNTKISSVAVSADNSRVLTASNDDTARVWDITSGDLLKTLVNSSGPLSWASFNSSNQEIVAASGTHIFFWSGSGDAICPSYNFSPIIVQADMSPDGQVMLVRTKEGSRTKRNRVFIDYHANRPLEVSLPPPLQPIRLITSAALSHTAKFIAIGDSAGQVWLWEVNMESGTLRDPKIPPASKLGDKAIRSLAFSAGDDQLLFGGDDGIPRKWNLKNEVVSFEKHYHPIKRVAFGGSEALSFLTLDSQGQVRVFPKLNKAPILLKGHAEPINDASFSSDGRCVVTASNDQTARVWETATGVPLEILQGHADNVVNAVFSPDGKKVVTGSSDGTARIYSINVCSSAEDMLTWANTQVSKSE